MRHLPALVLVAVAACKGDPAPASSAPPAPAPAPVAAPVAPPAITTGTGDVMNQILAQLEKEKRARPTAGPSSEAVVSALAAAGIELEGVHQVVAATVRARYCRTGITAGDLSTAICEYDSPEAAAAGRDYVMKQFAPLNPIRDIVVHGATTLTLTSPESDRHQDIRTKAIDAFTNL